MLEELKKILAALEVIQEMAEAGANQKSGYMARKRYVHVVSLLRAAEHRVKFAMLELKEL